MLYIKVDWKLGAMFASFAVESSINHLEMIIKNALHMEHMKAHQKYTNHNIDLIRSLYRPLSLSLSLPFIHTDRMLSFLFIGAD